MPRRAPAPTGRPHVPLPHVAGLDGLRGIAVVAVILYHGGVRWAPGGFLGVELFFVLSGFLITSLLVAEWARSSTIALRAFWARRARRLLPALFVLVLVIGVYYALGGPAQAIPNLETNGISTLLYFNNWHQIATGTNYFAASGPISPLQHTWSLAIEEQFYVVWPLVVLGVLGLARRRGASGRRTLQILLGLSLAGALASAAETALLFDGGRGLDRVYYGTDTRAAGLLIGAALAITVTIRRRWPKPASRLGLGPARRRLLGAGAVAAVAALLAGVGLVRGSDGWVYPYGLLALDGAAAIVIVAAVTAPGAAVSRLLSVAPLRGLGAISYGLYLWHFPLFLWLDESSTGTTGTTLLVLRLSATLAVSLLSYRLVEQPIRRRQAPAWFVRGLVPAGAGTAFLSLVMASAAASLPAGVPAAAVLPKAPPQLKGTDRPCPETLTDTAQYGLAPVASSQDARFEYTALGASTLVWSGSATKMFQTCPPKRVMVIGDSLAFTIGLPMMDSEENYGVELANAARLGCAFATKGQLDVNGTFEDPPAGCSSALTEWAQEEKALQAQEVIIELGYRDEFDWRWNGKTVHLGQPAFDAYIQQQIARYVQVLGQRGVKILFLSVPYTHPPDQADGAPPPAASPARHALINAMLEKEARRHPSSVRVLDLDRTISPGSHYDARVDGQLCRFDGIHFSVFCSKLLEPSVLGEARRLLRAGGRGG
ncbi:MAG TPA: acyltransferase family protein [Solirubrobacteraceae bacterium]|nr:acyltransferase family protein [Solirubrobacteraceae bacterium]